MALKAVLAVVTSLGLIVVGGPVTGDRAMAAASRVPIVNLGTLPAPYNQSSFALVVNDLNQVTGQSCDSPGIHCHGFFWTRARGMIDVGTLGGSFSIPYAMNALGQVVGTSALPG